MLENLHFARGDIDKLIISRDVSPLVKVFASISAANFQDIKTVIQEQLSKDIADSDETKIKLLAAVVYLVNSDNRDYAFDLVKSLGRQNRKRVSGFLDTLCLSLWNLLINYSEVETSRGFFKEGQKLDIAVIGDSHTIGLALGTKNVWKTGHYIPGLRLTLLAAPQDNLKIVGLKNAFALNYDKRFIYLSLGEIDFRVAALNFSTKPEGFAVLEKFIEPSFSLISKLTASHQTVFINEPYPMLPQVADVQSEVGHGCKISYERACTHLTQAAL